MAGCISWKSSLAMVSPPKGGLFLCIKRSAKSKGLDRCSDCACGAAPALIVGSLPTHNGTISRIFFLVEKCLLRLLLRVLRSRYEMNFHLYP